MHWKLSLQKPYWVMTRNLKEELWNRKSVKSWKQILSPTSKPWVPLSRLWKMSSNAKRKLQNNADSWTNFLIIKRLKDVTRQRQSFRKLTWQTTKLQSRSRSKKKRTTETRNWSRTSRGISVIPSVHNRHPKRRGTRSNFKTRPLKRALNNKLIRKINSSFRENRKTKK